MQASQYETIYRAKIYTNTTTNKATLYDPAQEQQNNAIIVRSPEELLALQFNHAKKLAKDAAGGENIKDTVVTVCFSHLTMLLKEDADTCTEFYKGTGLLHASGTTIYPRCIGDCRPDSVGFDR